jgi:hypothetical protein
MGASCGVLEDGKAVVDHIKSKQKENFEPNVVHEIDCECGETFLFKKVISNCPKCGMTYAVTPCSSSDKNNIKQAGIRYA